MSVSLVKYKSEVLSSLRHIRCLYNRKPVTETNIDHVIANIESLTPEQVAHLTELDISVKLKRPVSRINLEFVIAKNKVQVKEAECN